MNLQDSKTVEGHSGTLGQFKKAGKCIMADFGFRPGQPEILEIKQRPKIQISIKDERKELFITFLLHSKDIVSVLNL